MFQVNTVRIFVLFCFKILLFFFVFFFLVDPSERHDSIFVSVLVFFVVVGCFALDVNWGIIFVKDMLFVELGLGEQSFYNSDSFHHGVGNFFLDIFNVFCLNFLEITNLTRLSRKLSPCLLHGPWNGTSAFRLSFWLLKSPLLIRAFHFRPFRSFGWIWPWFSLFYIITFSCHNWNVTG